jgi:hypothetical protein
MKRATSLGQPTSGKRSGFIERYLQVRGKSGQAENKATSRTISAVRQTRSINLKLRKRDSAIMPQPKSNWIAAAELGVVSKATHWWQAKAEEDEPT